MIKAFVRILILSLTLYSLVSTADENNLQKKSTKAYTGVVENCPFKARDDQSVSDMLQSVKGSLRQLASDCPQLSEKVKQAENRLQLSVEQMNRNSDNGNASNFSTTSTSPNPSLEGIQINCNNYKNLLNREHEIAVSRIGVLELPTRYISCSSESNQSECINKKFMLSVTEAHQTCQKTATSRIQEDTIKKLVEATDSFATLIREVDQCPTKQRTPQLLLNTSASFLDTIASVSAGFGVTGIISGFLAKTIGAVLDSQAIKNSPAMDVRQIENESKFEDLACIWYQVQNRNLRCQEYQREKITQPNLKQPMCADYLNQKSIVPGTTDLKSLIDSIKFLKKDLDDEDINSTVDNISTLFNKKIADPIEGAGKSVTVEEHLLEISETLKKSSSLTDKESGRKINLIIESIKNITKIEADSTINESERAKKIEMFKVNFKNNLSKLKFDEAIDQYWFLKGAKVSPSALLIVDSNLAAYKAIQNLGTEYDSNIPKIHLATNLMVKHFRDEFVNRLNLTSSRYLAAVKEGDKTTTLAHAVQLTNLCGLAAGMYYANDSGDEVKVGNTLRKVKSQPPSDYERSCKDISCLQTPKPIIFKSEKKGTELAESFRHHECQMQLDYDVIMKNVKDRINRTGTVCE